MKRTHSRKAHSTLVAAAFASAALAGESVAQALKLGIDFGGQDAGNSVFVGDNTAGVDPQRFWNSIPTLPPDFSGTNLILFSDNGNGTRNASGVTLTFTANDAGNSGGGRTTPDELLTYGILKAGGFPPQAATFTLNNVPTGTYKVIAYTNTDSDDLVQSDFTLDATTYYTLEEHQFSGTYIRGLSTDPLNRDVTTSNYVQWDSVTPTANTISFTMTWQGGGTGAGIGGFQLVRLDTPPPAPIKTWSGTNSATWDISTSQNWNGGSEDFDQGDEVVFSDSGANKDVTVAGNVAPSRMTVNNSVGNDYSFTGGSIGGVGATLTKQGAGTLTINNTNTFTGTTFIEGGVIVVSSVGGANADGGLGRGGEVVLGTAASAGTLRYTGTGETVSRFLTVQGGGGTVEIANPAAALQLDGDASGTGTFVKAGPGTLNVTGQGGGLTGALEIRDGTLVVGSLGAGTAEIALGTAGNTPASRPTLNYSGAANVTSGRSLTVQANNGLGGAIGVTNAGAVVRLDGSTMATAGPLRKTGAGTLTLGGTVTMTAPVVEGGTLTFERGDGTNVVNGAVTVLTNATAKIVPAGIGSASVALEGGTLSLIAGAGSVINGFADGQGYTVNANAEATNSGMPAFIGETLQITSAVNSQATSVWNNVKQTISTFVAKFSYRESSGTGTADGAAFVLQNAGLNALGGGGGGLGYSGITPSAALQINIWDGAVANNGGLGIAYNINGAIPFDAQPPNERFAPVTPINLRSGNLIDFTLTYDGAKLTIGMAERNTNNTFTTERTTDLQSILGGGTAFVGFTGGTGGLNANQFFQDFRFVGGSTLIPESLTYNTNVSVAEGSTSTISADVVANSVQMANLALGSGSTLNTTGNLNLLFGATSFAGNANLNVETRELRVGAFTMPTTPITLGKSGSGSLLLETSASAPRLPDNSTVNISGGLLVAVGSAANGTPLNNATINFSNGGDLTLSSQAGDLVFNNPITVAGSGSITARKAGSGVAGTSLNAPITVAFSNSLNVPADTTLTLGSADFYRITVGGTATGSGTVGVSGGDVVFTTDTAAQGLRLSMNPAAGNNFVRFTTPNPSVASLSSSGAGTSRIVLGNPTAPVNATTLTVNGDNTDTRFAGIISNASSVSGATGALVKSGTGKLALSGSNNFSGGVTLNSGTLELGANTAAGTGQITINGGTIQFSGAGLIGQYFASPPPNINNSHPSFADLDLFTAHFDALGTPAVTAPTTTGGVTQFRFLGGGGAPFATQGFGNADNIQARWRGKIIAPVAGTYNFSTSSDDGSIIGIDGTLVVANNFFQGTTTRTGTIDLTAGEHDIVIGFYEGGGAADMTASWQPPGAAGFVPLPNSALFNVESFSGGNVVQMNADANFDLRGGRAAFTGALKMPAGTTLNATDGTLSFGSAELQGAGTYTFNKAAGSLILGPLTAASEPITFNKTGAGNLVLSSPASGGSPQLQNPANVVNVTGGSVTAVVGANNPFGASTVNLNGGGLNVSAASTAGATFNNPINVLQNATIGAGNFGGGAVNGSATAPVVATVASSGLTVGAGTTLTTQSSNNYTLAIAGPITGGGSLIAGPGVTRLGSTAQLNTLTVNGTLRAANNLTAAGGTTVNAGGVFGIDAGAGNTATYTGGAISVKGGTLQATSGVADFSGAAINVDPLVPNETEGALRGLLYSGFANPPGGFATAAGLAATLARTPTASVDATTFLEFGPQGGADGAFSAFFGVANADVFTAIFTGKFEAFETGPHSFGHSLNDDGAAVWLDLNQNGLFEDAGSAGPERLTFSGCCGNLATGMANLTAGQSYGYALTVQDTGGGSSISGFFGSPSFPESTIDPASQGVWKSESPTGGGSFEISTGAELRAGSLTGATAVDLAGGGATLRLSGPGASDSANLVRVSGTGGSTIDLGAGHELSVGSLTVNPGSQLTKTGDGNMSVAGQSFGENSTFSVLAGTVSINGGASGSSVIGNPNSGSMSVGGTGVVRVNGVVPGSMRVDLGGRLTGNGSVGPLEVVSGGNLDPGNGLGTLSTGTMSLFSGATVRMELSTPQTSDKINTLGSVSLGDSTLQLSLSDFAANVSDLFFLIINDDTDALTGTFANAPFNGAPIAAGDARFDVFYNGDSGTGTIGGGNDVVLRLTVIPEPTSLGLLVSGLALAGGLRRFRGTRRL